MRLLRIVLMLTVLAVGAVLLVQGIASGRPEAEETSLIQDETVVEVGALDVTVSATGSVQPAREVSLSFEVSFPVSEIMISEGDAVRAGDVLARLDVDSLDAALENARIALDLQQVAYEALVSPAREVDIAVAEAALAAARASAASVAQGSTVNEQEIARLRAELARNTLWQQQLNRDLRLIPPEIPELPPGVRPVLPPVASPEEIARFEANLRQADFSVQVADANQSSVESRPANIGSLSAANAQIVAAQEQLDRLLNGPSEVERQIAEMELEQARLALAQAEANLARSMLIAPFDGVIARLNLVVGQLPPQTAAVQLLDASAYYVDLAIDETDILDVQVGQTARFALDALPDAPITGVVTRVAVTPTRLGQVVTYTARVTLDPTDEPIRVGMNTTATILVNRLEDATILRNRFIRIDRATQNAFVTIERDSGQFEDIEVEIGLRNDTFSEIISGLEPGQRVVLLPRESLIPGFSG